MYTTIVIVVVLAAILMCLIVLIQESKGGGLASSVADANSMMGVRKTTDFIEKATWTLAAVMIVLSVLSVAFIPDSNAGKSVLQNQATEQQATNPNNLPAIPQSNQTAAPAEEKAEATEAPAEAEAEAPATEAPADSTK